jgi:hypothetical protein
VGKTGEVIFVEVFVRVFQKLAVVVNLTILLHAGIDHMHFRMVINMENYLLMLCGLTGFSASVCIGFAM